MDSLQETAKATESSQALRAPGSLALEVERGSAAAVAHGQAEMEVLENLWAEARPLTLRELHRATGLPLPALEAALANLRKVQMIQALNTLIESYVLSRSAARELAILARGAQSIPRAKVEP